MGQALLALVCVGAADSSWGVYMWGSGFAVLISLGLLVAGSKGT